MKQVVDIELAGRRLTLETGRIAKQADGAIWATYGQVAGLAGGVTARMVGYAMSALPDGSDVPWPRVINVQGKISPHGMGIGSLMQRQILESEGVEFDLEGRIDFNRFGWLGDPRSERRSHG